MNMSFEKHFYMGKIEISRGGGGEMRGEEKNSTGLDIRPFFVKIIEMRVHENFNNFTECMIKLIGCQK
jgi:hypothetical protein